MSVNDIRREVTTELFDVKCGDDHFNKTFIFGNEDHTLGNALRHILSKKREVDFCGYSVPHPYEPKMNIRLQTHDINASDVLHDGLDDLDKTADKLKEKFQEALRQHRG